jgi:hypothetical protein
MKLRNLLEVEYGVYDLLKQHMDQIKLDSGPHTYRMLQTQLALGKDAWVENWLREKGYLEDPDDAPPNDKGITPTFRGKALPFEEQIKNVIKKEIDECWKTHKQVGMKKKGGKTVPNCVPKNEEVDEALTHPRQLKPAKEEMYEEIDALHENEEYCPKCATKIKEAIKEEIEKVAKEAKTKPAKGKRFAKKVKNKKTGRTRTVSYGQAGKAKKGGDRIRPGTAKGNAYCARSAKIKKCKNPPCANTLSRKKWKCQGSRSVK